MAALYIKIIGLILLLFGVCIAAWSQLPIATSQAGAYFIYQNVPGRTALNSPRIVNIPDSAHIFLNAKEIKSDSIASVDTLQGKIFGFTSAGLWVKSNYLGQAQVNGLTDTLKLYLKTAGVTPTFLATVLGYTPVSASDLSPYATKALMNDSVAAVRAAIPTNNNQLINGSGYINASHLSPYLTIASAASTYYPLVGNPSGFGTVSSVGVASTDLSVAGSPITTSGNITANLTTTGVSAGVYDWVTVDTKGRVTAAGNPVNDTLSSARAFNQAFQMSTTAYVDINPCVNISCNLSLTAGQSGEAILEVSANGTSGWIAKGNISGSNTGTLTIGINTTQITGGCMTVKLDPGWYWRIRTNNVVGTPTYTMRQGNKTTY